MRQYTPNSPEAAARIIALVLISDGHVGRTEIDTLKRLQVEQELGLAPGVFDEVVQALCEDLLSSAYSQGSLTCHIDEHMLAALLADVSDAKLRRTVLRLAEATAEADHYMAESEALVLASARQQWGLASSRFENAPHERVVLATA